MVISCGSFGSSGRIELCVCVYVCMWSVTIYILRILASVLYLHRLKKQALSVGFEARPNLARTSKFLKFLKNSLAQSREDYAFRYRRHRTDRHKDETYESLIKAIYMRCRVTTDDYYRYYRIEAHLGTSHFVPSRGILSILRSIDASPSVISF